MGRLRTVSYVLVLLTLLGPSIAAAVPRGPAGSVTTDPDELAEPARDAGEIEGRVEQIDYHAGRMTIAVGRRMYEVVVQPSTSISGRSKAFYEIADIKRGAHVEVLMSQKAGTYIAQIIHIL